MRLVTLPTWQETRYLIDANRSYAEVLEEYSRSGTVQVSYVYGQSLISQNRSGVQSFYEKDDSGSTRALTNIAGNVTDTYTYDAFGNLIGSTGSTVNNYRYTGEQYDPILGDYYLRARYYNPGSERFIRRDSFDGHINDPVSLHKYLYANANPITYIDPSGFASTEQGNQVAAVIKLYFLAEDPLGRSGEQRIVDIWNKLQIRPIDVPRIGVPSVPVRDRGLKPDLVDYRNRQLYEIGTLREREEKIAKMTNRYLPGVNNALQSQGRVPDWTAGNLFIPPSIVVIPNDTAIVYPPDQGVISYQLLFEPTLLGLAVRSFVLADVIAILVADYITLTAATKGLAI